MYQNIMSQESHVTYIKINKTNVEYLCHRRESYKTVRNLQRLEGVLYI